MRRSESFLLFYFKFSFGQYLSMDRWIDSFGRLGL